MKKAIKETNLDDKLKKRLTPDSEITPRIYGAPKVHKKDVPLRPIVNTIGSPTYELTKYVASILAPLVGKTSSYIKDSNQFVNFIKNTTLDPEDKMVSFDVVQGFAKIPLDEAIQVIKEVANPQTAKLAEICLRSTFFSFHGEIFEQTSGVAMGSPLSPIVANLFMEKFETKALDSYPLKPKFWVRFVDDTSVNWPHGDKELKNFLNHLNSTSEDIKFTIEMEENNCIPFLDILLIRNKDGSIGHKVFRKKAHTDNYLHADSHHHPAQKMGVLQTLFTRACRISDDNHTDEEITYLKRTFANLGYSSKSILKAINKAKYGNNINKTKKPVTSNAYLPYIQGVTDKIAKILRKKDIKTSFKPLSTIKQKMKSVKDSQD